MSWYQIKRDRADIVFSCYIRGRDKVCVVPGCDNTMLQNSHYWGRGKESTRFNPDNCDALCAGHHDLWEHQKEININGKTIMGEYAQFKINQLGWQHYNGLKVLAHTYQKKDRKLALIKAKMLLKTL